VLSTRVSTLGDDVAHGWDPAVCAAGRDGDGIMLVSAMAERAPGQSLPAVAPSKQEFSQLRTIMRTKCKSNTSTID